MACMGTMLPTLSIKLRNIVWTASEEMGLRLVAGDAPQR